MEKQKREITVISYTGRGTALNDKLCRILSQNGHRCSGFAPAGYLDRQKENEKTPEEGSGEYTGIRPLPSGAGSWIGRHWGEKAFVFIGAAGIAVRSVAPWIKDKFTDSPVVVMDEACRYVIPLLSGHIGGAARLAGEIAALMGAEAVQTTATDVRGKFAVDVFAAENGLLITDREKARKISAAVLEDEEIGFYISDPWIKVRDKLNTQLRNCNSINEMKKYRFRILISQRLPEETSVNEEDRKDGDVTLCLVPRNVTAGIGCRKGIPAEQFRSGLEEILTQNRILPEQIRALVSIDLKKQEKAILQLAEDYGVLYHTRSAEQLSQISAVTSESAFVEQTAGVGNVCERAALYDCPDGVLLAGKTVRSGMTAALSGALVELFFDRTCSDRTCPHILIFAGTTEGRELARFASENGVACTVSAATEYGGKLLEQIPGVEVLTGRMDQDCIRQYLRKYTPDMVIDATHPFAADATRNIRAACREEKTAYVRCLRGEGPREKRRKTEDEKDGARRNVTVDSVAEAAEYLKEKEGNILIATGSKELAPFTQIPDYRERCFARVLSTETAVKESVRLGFEGAHLMALQGPFSLEMNTAMLRCVNAEWFVTKESGAAGGYAEKEEAARICGASLVTVRRPQEEGKSMEEIRRMILEIRDRRNPF